MSSQRIQIITISKHLTKANIKLNFLNIHFKKSVQKKTKHRREKESNKETKLDALLSKVRSNLGIC
jgi:hypothetical protein